MLMIVVIDARAGAGALVRSGHAAVDRRSRLRLSAHTTCAGRADAAYDVDARRGACTCVSFVGDERHDSFVMDLLCVARRRVLWLSDAGLGNAAPARSQRGRADDRRRARQRLAL